ncbi:MAG: hypothetical protein KatS3mg076_2383 [Candidatus Binatia bacterium]|nr:MAG: hypothetical protein KatS3mg076_2383 [Candidatus Binatia bacterium]
MDTQTLLLLPIVVAAGAYVAYSLLGRRRRGGCESCPGNPARKDDYV